MRSLQIEKRLTMEFTDKKVVVTGANRGIGLAITRQFLEGGATVIGFVRTKESFPKELLEIWKEKLILVECDISREESIAEASKALRTITRKVDILVNNAGVLVLGKFAMMSLNDIRRTYEVNVFGTMAVTQRLLRFMIKDGGAIINISSMMDSVHEQGTGIYASTKAAISSWTKSLAKELGVYRIRVNAVCPGNTETNMLMKNTSQQAVDGMTEKQVIQRFAKPEEIADAVVFLASDKAGFMTGSLLRVDGGFYA